MGGLWPTLLRSVSYEPACLLAAFQVRYREEGLCRVQWWAFQALPSGLLVLVTDTQAPYPGILIHIKGKVVPSLEPVFGQ